MLNSCYVRDFFNLKALFLKTGKAVMINLVNFTKEKSQKICQTLKIVQSLSKSNIIIIRASIIFSKENRKDISNLSED